MWRSEDSWHCHMHGRVDVNSVIHIMGLKCGCSTSPARMHTDVLDEAFELAPHNAARFISHTGIASSHAVRSINRTAKTSPHCDSKGFDSSENH